MAYCVYILHCADGSYYAGSTSDLEMRLAQHEQGSFGGYTVSRRPVHLVFCQEFAKPDEPIGAERKIKGWSRSKKSALIAGDFDLLDELAKCRNETSHGKQNE